MRTRVLEYADGSTRFLGHFAFDEAHTQKRPGVLVFPDAFGLNEQARSRAEALVEVGYVALAVDLYGEGRTFKDMPSMMPAIQELFANRSVWRRRAQGALEALIGQPQVDAERLGAIGFCFGGTTCLELARSGAPLKAAVTFHAGLNESIPGDAERLRTRLLICHGANDPLVSHEQIHCLWTELRSSRSDWQFISFGNATHGFTNPHVAQYGVPGLAYDQAADERSWRFMRQWFEDSFA